MILNNKLNYSRISFVVLCLAALTAQAAAFAADDPGAVRPGTMTADRLWATTAAFLALAGVIVGGLALARSTGRIGNGTGRKGAIVALTAAVIAAVNGALVVITADGGPGTGNGIIGGAVALVLGVIAATLGWMALARSRPTA